MQQALKFIGYICLILLFGLIAYAAEVTFIKSVTQEQFKTEYEKKPDDCNVIWGKVVLKRKDDNDNDLKPFVSSGYVDVEFTINNEKVYTRNAWTSEYDNTQLGDSLGYCLHQITLNKK